MIEKYFAVMQVDRLTGLDFYPREQAAVKELVLAVQSSLNEAIAEYVVGEWLRESSKCPKPAEIRRMIWSENEKREALEKQRISSCRICHGTGWETIQRAAYTGVRECVCRSKDYIEPDPLPYCSRCQGFGYYGGHIGGQYAGPWKWCDCVSARTKAAEDPQFIDIANQERTELIQRISKAEKKLARGGPMSHVTQTIAALSNEDYHGEF